MLTTSSRSDAKHQEQVHENRSIDAHGGHVSGQADVCASGMIMMLPLMVSYHSYALIFEACGRSGRPAR